MYKVETAGDCYIVAGALMALDDEGFMSVDDDPDHGKGAEKVMSFAKVGYPEWGQRGGTMSHPGGRSGRSPRCVVVILRGGAWGCYDESFDGRSGGYGWLFFGDNVEVVALQIIWVVLALL